MAAICCEIQNKRSTIAAKYKTKEVKQKSAIIFKVCHETGAQLGGCLDGIPCPFTMFIKKPNTIDRLMKWQFFVGIKARFHYKRGKKHSLLVLLLSFALASILTARFNRRSIKERKNALFHARSGNRPLI